MFLLKLSACVEKCYIIFPLNTKLSFPKSASGRGVPGANKPKTEDPEPLIAAYMAPFCYSSSFISPMAGYCGNTLASKSFTNLSFHSLTGRAMVSFNEYSGL